MTQLTEALAIWGAFLSTVLFGAWVRLGITWTGRRRKAEADAIRRGTAERRAQTAALQKLTEEAAR